MTSNNTDEQIRHVFDEWHRAVKDQDAEGMAALYADDGVLETPAVLALWPDREDAVVHGRDAIGKFFAQSFQARSGEGVFEDWYRSVDGSRERADHPPPRLLGMGGVQQAPQRHQQGPPVTPFLAAAQVAVGRKRSADQVSSMETCRTGWMPWEATA